MKLTKLFGYSRRAAVLSVAVAATACGQGMRESLPPVQPAPPGAKVGPLVQTTNPMMIEPMGPRPDWAPDIDPQMLAVIEQLSAFEQPPFPEMTAFQARNAKTPAEAVMALLMKTGIPPMPPKVDIGHRVVPNGAEGVLVRTYTPLQGNRPMPVIVYYHGGGWVIADLDTYEPSAMALAAKTGAIVVSVAYRQAPEHKFPAAHEDAFAAYKWVTKNAAALGGDPNRIATAGESAGGNLSVAVALMARERSVRMPVHILSVYPIADGDLQSPSYQKYANAVPLSRGTMEWFFDKYLRNSGDARNPVISLTSANLAGLPPTTIINAQIDPLQAEGEELAQRMSAAGVQVEQRTFEGVTHEFFGMAAVLEQAVQAQDMAAMRLRQAFRM
jgi:acetyl esterase/lipase